MKRINKILETLKQYEAMSEDEANELYYKAQDVALDGCKTIVNKLHDYIREGYVEDFYNLLVSITSTIENDKIDPRKLMTEIQNDSLALPKEEQTEDQQWLVSCIDANTHTLEQFNNILQEKTNG